ncbi:SPOR domain-containing protein [Roseobacteraceae bacterium NS-SX3]
MKITRIIALAIIAGSAGAVPLAAQTLRTSGPPAEYPPASYQGRQYVDSRGCVYIRAGIDGNVTWVPRVTRTRKQLCGYKPTEVAGTTQRPQQTGPAPELITLEPSQQPQTAAAAPAPAKPKPVPPRVQAAAPKPAPAPVKPRRTAAPAAPAPVRVTAAPAPRAAPAAQQPAAENGCAGISEISQRYTNSSGVRCGPQAAPPVTYGPQSSLQLTPNTRVLQAHIYQDRRLSNSFDVPKGYRPVWTDGRLNPHRAERTMRPAVISGRAVVPPGYLQAGRGDGRLNPMRGVRTAEGDAQMARIWTNDVPRKLVELPLDRPIVRLSDRAARSPAEAKAPMVLRLSTRSAPGAAAPKPRRYVRAATFKDTAKARAAARKLQARGLPVRLGTLTRGGQAYQVVLAGPFTAAGPAEAALASVKSAGFAGARLSK